MALLRLRDIYGTATSMPTIPHIGDVATHPPSPASFKIKSSPLDKLNKEIEDWCGNVLEEEN